MYKSILYACLVISLLTYLFWDKVGLSDYNSFWLFQIGNAMLIFLLCLFIFINFKKWWISFLLFSLSLNNLFDELFFDNTTFGLNEMLFAVLIIFIAFWKYGRKNKTRSN